MDSLDCSPFVRFDAQGFIVLDGGLASELENEGFDLRHFLWSAEVLESDPDAIKRIHLKYLDAGADVIICSSYQASVEGFGKAGKTEKEAWDLIRLSAKLAMDARDEYWKKSANRDARQRPLVAGSCGPYGAILEGGKEYEGKYGLTEQQLYAFHAPRMKVLKQAGVDCFACETIPSPIEAKVLSKLLEELQSYGWISFSCKDEHHVCEGQAIDEALSVIHSSKYLIAVGVNCTKPEFVASILKDMKEKTHLPLVCYPNKGEDYDGDTMEWVGSSSFDAHKDSILWFKNGAKLIGGCCRVRPEDIKIIRKTMMEQKIK